MSDPQAFDYGSRKRVPLRSSVRPEVIGIIAMMLPLSFGRPSVHHAFITVESQPTDRRSAEKPDARPRQTSAGTGRSSAWKSDQTSEAGTA